MRAKSMLLCKAPFTPRYDNVVTGCTSQELYTRLAISGIQFPFSSIRTEFYETDTSLKFSLTLANYTIPPTKIRLDEYNYIAFKEDDNKISFWFIDGWQVENAFEFPTATLECTKDFWHTYCLDLTSSDTYKQHIIRKHTKMVHNDEYDYSRALFYSPSPYPHRTTFNIKDRVLWAKAKINTIYSQDGTVDLATEFGFPFDGNNLTVYIPLFYINDRNDIISEIGYIDYYNDSNSIAKLQLIELPIDKDGIATATEDVGAHVYRIVDTILNTQNKIEHLSSHPMVTDIELTFIPPFYYEIRENDSVFVYIDYDEHGYYKCNVDINGVDGVSMYKYGGLFEGDVKYDSFYDIEYDTSLLGLSNSDEYNMYIPPNFNRYCVIGGNKIEIPIPCKKVRIRLQFNGSTDGYSASIYFDGERYTYNIISSPNSKISLSRSKGSTEEALYGSSYRDASFIRNLISGTLNVGGGIINTANALDNEDSGKILKGGRDVVNSYSSLAETYNSYYRAYSTPDNITNGYVLAGSTIFGDYPYIVNEIIHSHYYYEVLFEFIKYGEQCNIYDYIVNMNREKFSFVRTVNAELYSYKISQKCNDLICSILNRGVHLWNIRNITSFNQIGDYSVENSEV